MSRKTDIEKAYSTRGAICDAAYDLGVIAGLRRAARLKHVAYPFISVRSWSIGHDKHREACRTEARRLERKGRKV